jgi:hypothetical protein
MSSEIIESVAFDKTMMVIFNMLTQNFISLPYFEDYLITKLTIGQRYFWNSQVLNTIPSTLLPLLRIYFGMSSADKTTVLVEIWWVCSTHAMLTTKPTFHIVQIW